MRANIVAGAVFPDYDLTDHTGERRKLSELQGPDPMILVLSRGGILPQGSAPGRRSGPTLPRDGGRLLPPCHHQYRQHACDE